MRMLTAIFSYNRGDYLENCVRSFHLFSCESELVVFDDRSDDELTKRVLDRIDAEVIVADGVGGDRGGLFDNMNSALELAAKRDFDLLHLIQDDFQFVWRNERLLLQVEELLARENASQVTVHFWKRLGFDRSTVLPDRTGYRSGVGIGDVGVVSTARFRDRGFTFEQSEAASNRKALELGLSAYALADPVLARIPWARYSRYRRMHGSAQRTSAPLLVKPLEDPEVKKLIGRDLRQRPFGDDLCEPWGWRCWKPYPTGPSYANWLKSLLAAAKQNRGLGGLVPRRVGTPYRRLPPRVGP